METKYKLIPLDNGEFEIWRIKEGTLAHLCIAGSLPDNTYSISNTKDKILQMYEEREAELKALEKYPIIVDDILNVDWNADKRDGYRQAILDNKEKKYTEEQMREAICIAFKAQVGDLAYDIINKIKPKLREVFVELDMEIGFSTQQLITGRVYVPKIIDNKVRIKKMLL